MKLYEPFKFLTTEQHRSIVDYARQQQPVLGTTQGPSTVRNNRVVWYRDSQYWDHWIDEFNTIEPVIDWIQTPQISYYRPGESYGWHRDQDSSKRTHERYFTLTCELQTADGGYLEIENCQQNNLAHGEAIIFHSERLHRAVSPTRGERISLTIWAMAKNYHKN
jgi:hypothetical protein